MSLLNEVLASARKFIDDLENTFKDDKQTLKSELDIESKEKVHTDFYLQYRQAAEAYGELSSNYAELEVENERLILEIENQDGDLIEENKRLSDALWESDNELDDLKVALKCLLDGELIKTFSFKLSGFSFIDKHDVRVEFVGETGIVKLIPWEQ